MSSTTAYTDFLGGRVTFTQIGTDLVRMTGGFSDGFEDADAEHQIYVGDFPAIALDGVEPPAAKPFEYDFNGVTIEDFTGIVLRVTAGDTIIATSESTIAVD
ncbi:hypothetical protein [Streptomyces virginiae]|uniref:hypothetical protein n=1 Tax=Streptomyces virginiae TaxID=1961 RepID=UPI00345D41C0